MIRLAQACVAVGGLLYSEQGELLDPHALVRSGDYGINPSFANVGIDTRKALTEGLFVALKGPIHDGHDFIDRALEQGAQAIMVQHRSAAQCPQIVVDNTYSALTVLAYWWRREHHPTLVALTGSVGKTSVKSMLAAILEQQAPTLATLGNLNNEIGVPLTLLRLRAEHRFAVIEMGMNRAGEIDRLTRLAAPSVALVNNAAEAHLEVLGTVAAVAAAKGEIYAGLDAHGTAIVNADDTFSSYWKGLVGARPIISFGMNRPADVTATYTQNANSQRVQIRLPSETVEFDLHGRGRHNVMNALAAATTAFAAGASAHAIASGLATVMPVEGRLTAHQFGAKTVFDDTYNANPASIKAALGVLAEFTPALAILGDMAELGSATEALHRAVGESAAQYKIATLWCCGQFAQHYLDGYFAAGGLQGQAFSAQAELLAYLNTQTDLLEQTAAVLVKGSRSAQMERVAAAVMHYFRSTKHHLNQSQETSHVS